jgi:hypothetical protein
MVKTREEVWYIVPEIEIRVHESWISLIRYCQESLPYGELKVQISNAQPTKRMKETPNIRFDKQMTAKQNGITYMIESLDFRVHEYWVNLIQWCQNYFVKGEIEFKLVNALPTELVYAKQDVRFDKRDTIPDGVPLVFDK